MTLLEDVRKLLTNTPINPRTKNLADILRNESEIVEVLDYHNGEGLIIRYKDNKYFNFCDVTKELLKNNLIIYAIDHDNGIVCVWLRTIDSLK